jgi:hypothetical protein
MSAPFEGLFGNSCELRLVQFLLPLRDLEYNISEMAREIGMSRQAVEPVVKKFVKWGVLKTTNKHGNAYYYALDEKSGFAEAFETLNNRIIERMLGEEALLEIEKYHQEHSPNIVPLKAEVKSCYIDFDSPDNVGKNWMRINSVKLDWVELPAEQPYVRNVTANRGEYYARASAA